MIFEGDYWRAAMARRASTPKRHVVEYTSHLAIQLGGAVSPHVPAIVARLLDAGYQVTTEPVPYECHRGGNEMLRIRRQA